MKQLIINFNYTAQTFIYLNDEEATKAYNTIKEAMDIYKPFSNDKEASVEIFDEYTEGRANFKVKDIIGVSLCNVNNPELDQKLAEIKKQRKVLDNA